MTVALRPAAQSDEPFLLEVFASARDLHRLPLPPEHAAALVEQQYRAQASQLRATHPGATYSVIQIDGVDAGRLVLTEGDDELWISDITLLPAARGGGAGSELLRALQVQAVAAGRGIGLSAEIGSPAVRFYERLGFTEQARSELHIVLRWRAA